MIAKELVKLVNSRLTHLRNATFFRLDSPVLENGISGKFHSSEPPMARDLYFCRSIRLSAEPMDWDI